MIQASAPAVSATRSAAWPALAAMILGLGIVFVAGFVQSEAIHNATHDTRHAFGLPCH